MQRLEVSCAVRRYVFSIQRVNLDLLSIINKDTHGDKTMSGIVFVQQLDTRSLSVLWPFVPAANHRGLWSNGG